MTKNTYAIIYFEWKKPIKKKYNTAVKAFYDHEEKGCILTELYNEHGIRLSSMKKNI